VQAPPAVSGDMLFVHARTQWVYGINLKSGEVVWKFNTTPPAR